MATPIHYKMTYSELRSHCEAGHIIIGMTGEKKTLEALKSFSYYAPYAVHTVLSIQEGNTNTFYIV